MFEFNYHDQMQFVLWMIWWFIFVCRFCGMRTVQADDKVLFDGEGNDNEILTSVSTTKPVVNTLRSVRNVYVVTASIPACSNSSQPHDDVNDNTGVDYSKLTIRELKAECKRRTGTPNAVKGYSRMSKAALIAALSAQQ